ncbi:MAG: phosphomannomutase, partial [Pseudomonadota bacterium]
MTAGPRATPHRFDPTILRAYDVRGVVGDTLAAADARALGRALGTLAARRGLEGSVALGFDGRLSSPELADAAAAGLAEAGRDVVEIGLGPTPMLYYAAAALDGVVGGMQITGSHNPPDYNGFKITLAGAPFYGDDIQELGRIAETGAWAAGDGARRRQDVNADYVARLLADAPKAADFKVVWDCGNGAAGAVIDALIAGLPGEHHVLFGDVDGRFPNHHPD